MEYILENVPEYQKASQQLEKKMDGWKAEIEKMEDQIDQMEASLNNERILLTKELIEEREEEIEIKRQELRDYQFKRFGADGDFIKQKKQLIQPVQDQVFNEVQKIGGQKKYDVILDRSETTMLYSADRHDLSEDVLRAIGRMGKLEERKNNRNAQPLVSDPDEPYLSVQEAADEDAKAAAKEQVKLTRAQEREAKVRARDSIKEVRAREFRERRERLLEERRRKKDSIRAVRTGQPWPPEGQVERTVVKDSVSMVKSVPSVQKKAQMTKEQELAEKIRVRDSIKAAKAKQLKERRERILEERRRKKDSIIAARKKAREQKKNEPKGGN
jgi:Skp family chaperone for outer membrane proteins